MIWNKIIQQISLKVSPKILSVRVQLEMWYKLDMNMEWFIKLFVKTSLKKYLVNPEVV